MLKRTFVSLLFAIACTIALAVVAYLSSGTPFARFVLLAGDPISQILFRVLPSDVMYALIPEGGAASTATIFALSSLFTWLLIFWLITFVLFPRLFKHPLRGGDLA
ncbi:MAG: hypothetical protein ACRDAM_08470 [Casimicrobium sp.]